MQKYFWALALAVLSLGALVYARGDKVSPEAAVLKAGKKIVINGRYAFRYEFPQKPRLGTTVLKINVFDATLSVPDNKVTDLVILASSDMPSMRGHHTTPPKPVQTNKNKDYLYPVDLVMRGEWEIVLSFQENGQEIYNGVILLKI